MQIHVDPADQRFLARLNRLGHATISQLCDELNVTATAVRQRLSRLMGQSLIERETVPSAAANGAGS